MCVVKQIGEQRRSWNDFSDLNASGLDVLTVFQLSLFNLFHDTDEISRVKTLSLLSGLDLFGVLRSVEETFSSNRSQIKHLVAFQHYKL
jgi:hypothetical protein